MKGCAGYRERVAECFGHTRYGILFFLPVAGTHTGAGGIMKQDKKPKSGKDVFAYTYWNETLEEWGLTLFTMRKTTIDNAIKQALEDDIQIRVTVYESKKISTFTPDGYGEFTATSVEFSDSSDLRDFRKLEDNEGSRKH